ncbi:MAG: phage portal protein [Clostridia bacterium]|nr:phage portal protein [Clostridia bacterium]
MGLIDRIFGKPKAAPAAESRFETITAYSPVFSSWGGQIYESELVRAAVDAKARHVGKLQYKMNGTAKPKLYTATKTAPNPWYTWPQFLERCSNIYDVQNNLFIVPLLDDMDEVSGFFPVLPSGCEVVNHGGVPYLKYSFMNGQKRSMPLRRCAVITKHQLKDDFFGESNRALVPTMELVNMVNQGIMEGVKNGATFRFMAQMNGKTFDEDLRKERERFDRNNFQGGGGGLLLFGNQMQNIQQLKQEGFKIDAEQMKLIQESVENYFGVSAKVIRNEATGDELDAFYNGAIEPFAIKLSDALTRMTFTERERNGGNAITFAGDRLQYMNISSKISMAQQLGDRGILTIDEIRALFNYDPLPGGIGQHVPARGEYYFVDEGKEDGGNQDE